ncbi:hypothetical protein ACQVPP_12950 [Bacillus luti]|uniref:hypothetical protein n=1 Tax=Bacillus luti TaxID=2026191 RepID=UPI003D6566DB
MDSKLKHLEFIQQTITRMASNSFKLKGWTVTLLSALLIFILSNPKVNLNIFYLSFLPVLAFWYLDAFFLKQERLFRKLYEDVREKENDNIDFSMNTSNYASDVKNILNTMFSKTLFAFYGIIFITVGIIIYLF